MNGKLVIVGCGNWGKNLVRNFCQILGPEQVIYCDQSQEVVQEFTAKYPGVGTVTDVGRILEDTSVSAAVIATPVPTHYQLTRQALLNGKHVLVEKPLATNVGEASDLCALAQKKHRVLMLDHLLLFHPAVRELERQIRAGELGSIYYMYSRRTNLGVVRSEENALWSLGPHDIAVMVGLLGQEPVRVSAHGGNYLQPHLGIQDVVFMTLVFPDEQVAHLHLSWLDPRKAREITVIGSRKMAVFDDSEPVNKLRIYDKGIEFPAEDGRMTTYDRLVAEPQLDPIEPLNLTCQHFLDSIELGHAELSDGETGLVVVRILEAAQASLEKNGCPVAL